METSVITPLGDVAADVLGRKLMEFCHLLRAHEIDVTASRIIDTFRALKAIDFFRRGDFYTVLETNLISRVRDRELFHQLFLQFWSGPTWAGIPDPCLPGWQDECALPPHALQNSRLQLESVDGSDESDDVNPPRSMTMYSPTEMLSRKDFGKMSEQELMQVQRLISSMAQQMATVLSRRQKARRKAHGIDAGRTLRHSLRYGGEVVQLMRRGPKIGKTKMVLLCDVSGSMDVYTKFLLQFYMGCKMGCAGWKPLCLAPVCRVLRPCCGGVTLMRRLS